MTDIPMQYKIPEEWANRDYEVFGEFPDGSTVWRACVFGMENVELKLRELAKETTNKFFALTLTWSKRGCNPSFEFVSQT
jgi:hypothetical protein